METIAQTAHQGTERDSQTTAVALQGPACEPSRENVLKADKSVKHFFFFVKSAGERKVGWVVKRWQLPHLLQQVHFCTHFCRIITFHGI